MTATASSPWEALRAGFRRVCVRRLVGDEEGAVSALKNEIPGLVVGWAKTSPLEPAEKKAKLKEVFDDESARAEELAMAFELFASKFEAKVASRVSEEVSKAREEMLTVAAKFEQALMDFSGKFEQLLGETRAMPSISVPEPPNAEEPDAKSPSETKFKAEAEIESMPAPELVPVPDASVPEPELVPETTTEPDAPETERTPELQPEIEPEPEPEPEPVCGIRFDDIEGMIDELLAQEEG